MRVFKGKTLEERKKYFLKIRDIRDKIHSTNSLFILGVDKSKFNFEKDKVIIVKIENTLIKAENYMSDLLHRMQSSIK